MGLTRQGVIIRGSSTPKYIRDMLAASSEVAATYEKEDITNNMEQIELPKERLSRKIALKMRR